MGREELIAALEGATGPDRDLDDAIADTLDVRGWGFDDEGLGKVMYSAEPYTSSLDAALTLVPEGTLHTVITRLRDGRGLAHIVTKVSDGRYENGKRLRRFPAEPEVRSSPAIALCIAALKARGGGV